jgi:hypothetical protein
MYFLLLCGRFLSHFVPFSLSFCVSALYFRVGMVSAVQAS